MAPIILGLAPTVNATPVTQNLALVADTLTRVDASAGARTMTLPALTYEGAWICVEKTDSSANAVVLSGSIRGTTGTVSLTTSNETLVLIADDTSSWYPVARYK